MENNKIIEFNSVKPFDIIWARRDVEENEAFDDGKCYEGSYIVVGRDSDKLYCLRGGQKIKDYYDPYIVFSRLTKNKNGIEKVIYYIDIDIKEINYEKFINKKTRLNNEEKKDLICDIKKQGNLIDTKKFDMDLSIKAGDLIIKKEKKYIVVDKYCDKMFCLEFNDDKDFKDSFYIGDIKNINYKDIEIIKTNEEIKFINRISTKYFKEILSMYKDVNYELINFVVKQRNMRVGLLIELENCLYYVYSKDANNLMCHRIIELVDDYNYSVSINEKKYYCDYGSVIIISIKENFKVMDLAKSSEIVANLKEKINFCKKNDINYENNVLGLKLGMTFKINNNDNDYVFINQIGNMIEYISLNDLYYKRIKINYVNINEIKIINNLNTKQILGYRNKVISLMYK